MQPNYFQPPTPPRSKKHTIPKSREEEIAELNRYLLTGSKVTRCPTRYAAPVQGGRDEPKEPSDD